jgi:RNA polymerase sigma-70 factor (ECF subfamily)
MGLVQLSFRYSVFTPMQPFALVASPKMATEHPDASHADTDIHECLRAGRYRDALVLLLPRYRDKVFRLCLSMLRDRALAEDVTQDVFMRVWRALPGYGAQASLSTWIYAISRNACLSELRKRRAMVSLDCDDDEYNPEIAALSTRDSDDSATVSIGQVLDQLPERYRQAVTLFYMEDKSYEQTAASLGLPLGTVKALLHRARKRLIELTREPAAPFSNTRAALGQSAAGLSG